MSIERGKTITVYTWEKNPQNKTTIVVSRVKLPISYIFGSLHLFLLFFKNFIIILVLLKLFLAAVKQQFPEVHITSWLVECRDFQLREERIEWLLMTFKLNFKIIDMWH